MSVPHLLIAYSRLELQYKLRLSSGKYNIRLQLLSFLFTFSHILFIIAFSFIQFFNRPICHFIGVANQFVCIFYHVNYTYQSNYKYCNSNGYENDFIICIVALLLIGWLLIIITIWLHYANKGAGAFFLQERPGKDGKIFKIIKYKTMTDERDVEGHLLPDEQRLTKVGRFVRSTSIDELPQLLNVLKGDMALIGPRPLLVQYLPLYSKEQARRHEVRPGISGWAQCHGRNAISWTEKFKLDVWYVDHVSLKTDLTVVWLTIQKVLRRADISEQGHATMEVFNGHN